MNAMDRFVTVGYNRPLRVTDGVQLRFFDAGHILGSAIVLLEFEENGRSVHLGFTGDLGRKNMPILRDPWQVHALDVLITESTYGNRHHDDLLALNQKLAEVVNRTYNRGGKVIVPAFALTAASSRKLARVNIVTIFLNFIFTLHFLVLDLTVNIDSGFSQPPWLVITPFPFLPPQLFG